MYEPQYHPKAELGNIFGGAKTGKINEADDNHLNDTEPMDENGIPMHLDTDNSQIVVDKNYESTPLHSNHNSSLAMDSNDPHLKRKRSSIRFQGGADLNGPQVY